MMTLIDFPIDDGGRLHGRFGTPREVLTAWHLDDVVPLLQDAQDRAQNDRWVVGIVAYEAGPAFDPAFKVASAATDFPLAAFLVFDGIADIAGSTCTPGRFSCTPWRHDTAYAAFERTVETIRDQIAAGDYYQTNFTTRLTAGFTGDLRLSSIRYVQPSPAVTRFTWTLAHGKSPPCPLSCFLPGTRRRVNLKPAR